MKPSDQAAITHLRIYALPKKLKACQKMLSKRIFTGCECLIYKTAVGLKYGLIALMIGQMKWYNNSNPLKNICYAPYPS